MPTNPFDPPKEMNEVSPGEPPQERYAYPLSTQLIVGAIGIALAILLALAVRGVF